MSNLIFPFSRARQPATVPRINRGSVGCDLVFDAQFGGTMRGYDVARNVLPAPTVGTVTRAPGPTKYGSIEAGTFSSAVLGYGDVELLTGTTATIEYLVSPDTLAQTAAVVNKRTAFNSNNCFTAYYNAGSDFKVQIGAADGASVAIDYTFSISGFSSAGAYDHFIIVLDVAAATTGKVRVWRNGQSVARSSIGGDTALSAFPNTSANLEIGRVNASTLYFAGKIGFVRLYNRALGESEIASLERNPWSIYKSEPILLFAPAAAPAGDSTMLTKSRLLGGGILTNSRLAA